MNYADILFDQVNTYVDNLNKYCKETNVNNIYKIEIEDGKEPLDNGGSKIKNYKTFQFIVDTEDGSFLLYIAHIPVKSHIEAQKNKKWLLDVLKDFMYQCFTNYAVMSHATILEKEKKLKETKEELVQIGSLVSPEGKPLMKVKK